jgi:D-alanine--poly(phosphoribitol) ligase subunit 1
MCSCYKITLEDFHDLQGFPPLGRIADNFSYMILDEHSKQVSENEIGELCLLGPLVGKGYYNEFERTQESFVQNPFNNFYSEIMYKTGDLVLYNPQDQKIYIKGRKDHQIKHMGYRIELEEIETALSSLRYISQAAVIYGDVRGFDQIIAVICTDSQRDETIIRNDLQQLIPNYMIPTIFHFEAELPKNPNGKIDRRRLYETYTNN